MWIQKAAAVIACALVASCLAQLQDESQSLLQESVELLHSQMVLEDSQAYNSKQGDELSTSTQSMFDHDRAIESEAVKVQGSPSSLKEPHHFDPYSPELPFSLSASLEPLSELYPEVMKQPEKDENAINEDYVSARNLYQGDIKMPSVADENNSPRMSEGEEAEAGTNVRTRRASTAVTSYLWPLGVIPYTIDSRIHQDGQRMFAILAAMEHWRKKTCVTFARRRQEADYIEFREVEGCWSSIGRRGGAQVLSVGKRCGQIGIMIHEIGHALGLWHEHSRPDRNEYITIRWDNIEPLRYKNFARSSVDAIDSLGTPYDIGSIMHYGATSFGRRDPHTGLKRTTIELVDKDRQPGVKMGQRLALSSTDIQQMNLLYRCSKTGRVARSCVDYAIYFGQKSDGLYDITVGNCSKPLQVYCHGMQGDEPKTFITLSRTRHTYSHYYGPRLVGGRAEQGCRGELRQDEWKQKGVTLFSRVRLDTARMTLVQDDFTFSYSFGKAHRLGWAGDCYSRLPQCRRGALQIDLTDSGVQFAGRLTWYLRGGDVSDSFKQESQWLFRGLCGGWCGQCRLRNIRVKPDAC